MHSVKPLDRVGVGLWTLAGELEKLVGKADPAQIDALCTNLGKYLQDIKELNQSTPT
jgi:hypothetical protein